MNIGKWITWILYLVEKTHGRLLYLHTPLFMFTQGDNLEAVSILRHHHTVYPKKYAHSFVVLCFVVVMQWFIMNSHEVFIHIHQGCFAGTGAIVRLPQCQWSKPDGYGKISQCITTTKHSKAKTVCIFLETSPYQYKKFHYKVTCIIIFIMGISDHLIFIVSILIPGKWCWCWNSLPGPLAPTFWNKHSSHD